MGSNATELVHFLVIPLLSQSHLIPMTDFAKLVAQRGITVTIVTTPVNEIRFKGIIERATRANLKIQLIPLEFPAREAGLPEGFENMDSLTSPDLVGNFLVATGLLQESLENLIQVLEPPPSCIVSPKVLTWTSQIARKFKIPRFVFRANSCFSLVCSHQISSTGVLDGVHSDSEPFLVPNMPHRIEFTKAQLPDLMRRGASPGLKGIIGNMDDAENSAQGVIVNSFEELESYYTQQYKNMRENVWCVGPVSLCNKEISDKFDRGNKASIDETDCFKWLDSMDPCSVVYACFGSLCNLSPPQLIEIGLGLEASNRPFIWIIREGNLTEETEKWLEEQRFEERIKQRGGMIIRGWAPQVLILSHPAIGGFLTHCGWNSTLECVCAGVPMITWPMFAEQFHNEKFVVDVLKIGVRIGVEACMQWGEEERAEVLVKKEQIQKAIGHLMEGEGGEERRKRARDLGEMAKRESEKGGSSYLNIELLIQSVLKSIQDKRAEFKK